MIGQSSERVLPGRIQIQNEAQLEELLTTPNRADIEFLRQLQGDVMLIGAGGKMGPTLARRIRRAANAAGASTRVLAVSRYSDPEARAALEADGVETVACDVLDPEQVDRLPDCENILYMVGRKFGSSDRPDLTWASNALAPAYAARRFRGSRIVVFSSGNIYPFVGPETGGCTETDPVGPRGEYAQSSLARERMFEYFSREYGTRCLLYRLNYAVDLRYGVLTDIARQVMAGENVDVSVPVFNVIWQGDANSYALRSLALCDTPPGVLNVTGPETVSVRQAAEFFASRFGQTARFSENEGRAGLLNNAGAAHALLGYPEVPVRVLMDWVAQWVGQGGRLLNKPTKFQVTDGKF